jgi:diguanylate cyclase (GGDEF)-like protein
MTLHRSTPEAALAVASDLDADEGMPVELLGQAQIGGEPPPPAREALAAVLGVDSVDALSGFTDRQVRTALSRLRGLAGRLTAKAATDDLTGAMRRDAGIAVIQMEMQRAEREDTGLVVAVIDIDGLKKINDGQGHLAGDAVLRATAAAMRNNFRRYDVLVRWGGDEFVCSLPGADITSAAWRFADIQGSLAEATQGRARFSVGVAELRPGDTLEGLIARADADLYVSRRRRRRAEKG